MRRVDCWSTRFCLVLLIATGALLGRPLYAQTRFVEQTENIQALASLVNAGLYHCFNKVTVNVKTRVDHFGYIDITFKGQTHQFLPVPSNTGAVRLESKSAGLFWLQLSAKNMLFNSAGSRVADDCHLKNAPPPPPIVESSILAVGDLPAAPPPPPPSDSEQKQLAD